MYPTKQAKYGGWFVAGAVALSAIAGFTNSAALHEGSFAVSHLTGSITRVSMEFVELDLHNAWPFAVVLGCFFAGAVTSGALVGDHELGRGHRYSLALLIQAALLGLSALLATNETSLLSVAVASYACGLQNALASSFRGMVVRTTHMTGTVTDLAFGLGKFLRTRRRIEGQFSLLGSLVMGFFVGSIGGAWVADWLGAHALYFPAAASAVAGGAHAVLHRRGDV